MFKCVYKLSKQIILPSQCKYKHMCPQTIETTPSSEDSVTINTCVHKPSKQTRPPSQCKYKDICPQTIKTTPSSEDSGTINTCVHKLSIQNRHYLVSVNISTCSQTIKTNPFLLVSVTMCTFLLYDKRDDFNFPTVNFPFLCSNIPTAPAYGVYMSQLI
jgi:hypothetical protein